MTKAVGVHHQDRILLPGVGVFAEQPRAVPERAVVRHRLTDGAVVDNRRADVSDAGKRHQPAGQRDFDNRGRGAARVAEPVVDDLEPLGTARPARAQRGGRDGRTRRLRSKMTVAEAVGDQRREPVSIDVERPGIAALGLAGHGD